MQFSILAKLSNICKWNNGARNRSRPSTPKSALHSLFCNSGVFSSFNQINKQPTLFSLTTISPRQELGLIPQGSGAEPSTWRCQAAVTEDADASEVSRCWDRWCPTCALARGTRGPTECHICCGKALNTRCSVISWLVHQELVLFLFWRLIMCCLDVLDVPAPIKTSVTMNTWNIFAFPSSTSRFYHFPFPQQCLILLKHSFPACWLLGPGFHSNELVFRQRNKRKTEWLHSLPKERKKETRFPPSACDDYRQVYCVPGIGLGVLYTWPHFLFPTSWQGHHYFVLILGLGALWLDPAFVFAVPSWLSLFGFTESKNSNCQFFVS